MAKGGRKIAREGSMARPIDFDSPPRQVEQHLSTSGSLSLPQHLDPDSDDDGAGGVDNDDESEDDVPDQQQAGPSAPPRLSLSSTSSGRNNKHPVREQLDANWYTDRGGQMLWKWHQPKAPATGFGVSVQQIEAAITRAKPLLLQIPGGIWRSKTGLKEDAFIQATANERTIIQRNYPFFTNATTPNGMPIPDHYRVGAINRFWAIVKPRLQKADRP